MTEICEELQKAAHDKINLSKSKLSEFRTEIEKAVNEMEINLKTAVA